MTSPAGPVARRLAVPLSVLATTRPLLLVAGMLALLAGLAGGLVRLDFRMPDATADLALRHGPLMVCGFLGTVISLERAVGVGGGAYAAPLLTALAAASLVLGTGGPAPALLALAGSVALLATTFVLLRREPCLHLAAMATAVGAWCIGNVCWLLGVPLVRVTPWWAAFLVLMIAGERLELTRLARATRHRGTEFVAAAAVLLGGVAVSVVRFDAGTRIAGAGMLLLACWLLRHDVARRAAREHGLARFMATCLLAGHAWLAVSGLLWLVLGGEEAGIRRDAELHALFLGFVFGMIFAHAPVIFPAVLGRRVAYSPSFYAHVALLQATLVARVAGDLAGASAVRQWAGLGNVLAIVLFAALTARAVLRGGTPARST